MAEEFEESEIVFEDYYYKAEDHDYEEDVDHLIHDQAASRYESRKKKSMTNKIKSAPVNIPWLRCTDDADNLDGSDCGEMVPPHVIVGRRVEGKMMAFSVCTGNGRTLKGRDLSELRNSVLRMTGFLET